MSVFEPESVDYLHTARRPPWSQLPAPLRAAIGARIGRIEAIQVSGSGFTPAFAATITTDEGRQVFLKTAHGHSQFGQAITRETAVLGALPAGLPAPRMLWSDTASGWTLLCLQLIDGRMPGQPWTTTDLTAVLTAQERIAAALDEPDQRLRHAAEQRSFAEHSDQFFNTWRAARDGCGPSPAVPDWLTAHLPELARLEQLLPKATTGARAIMHFDLRPDNILITADGDAKILDWNWARPGPAFVDTVMLLITASGSHDVDHLLATHPTTADVNTEVIDAILAAVGGALIAAGARDPVPTSPWLRTHQHAQGVRALTWLARRRGWHP